MSLLTHPDSPAESLTLLETTPAEARRLVAAWVEEQGLPSYRTAQILPRLWQRPVATWDDATELPRELRTALDTRFPLPHLTLDTRRDSRDGTRKYLWRLDDGEAIESVLIPSGSRRTLCISSQAGCALGCRFCATGRMGFRRNLAAWEIAAQVRAIVLEDPAQAPTNVVFMGMGEPLLNWPAVDTALTTLNHPEGFGIGARHITVSTVGILPGMALLAQRPEQFRLAISLHAADTTTRSRLMPVERKYDFAAVLKAARAFTRRVTFEYVLIAGVNDGDEDASALTTLARPLGAMVNLLPLHPGGDPGLTPSDPRRLHAFADQLRAGGVEAVVRRSRGLDIEAACGQLRVAVDGPRTPRRPRA